MLIQYGVELSDTERLPKIVREQSFSEESFNCEDAETIVKMLNTHLHLKDRAEEYVYVIGFDSKMHPAGLFEISHGTVSCSVLSNREVFIRLLLCGAACFIMVHNHPSTVTTPSEDDIQTAIKLEKAGNLMAIPLKDCIIIGGNSYLSLKTEGIY